MKSSVTKTFRQQLVQLPASVQEQAAKAYALWRSDPYHSSLQFKRVSQRQPNTVRISSEKKPGFGEVTGFLGLQIALTEQY